MNSRDSFFILRLRRSWLLGSLSAALCLTTACAQQKNNGTPAASANATVAQQPILSFPLPDKLSVFGERVPLENPEVRERAEREWLLNLQQPAQLILELKRSARYFTMFSNVLKDAGVPDDFKYLSVAESALFMARSNKDAVGLWQFVEGTAKQYGLTVDEYVDERRHPKKSTEAAALLLHDAYDKFGSWTLAAAAFNMGSDGVRYNVELQGTKNFYDLYFNEETSRYILRIAVIKELLEHPERYGFALLKEQLYQTERSSGVKEYKAIENLATWAAEHGMTYKELKLLNPWMLKNSLPKPKRGFWEIAVKG